MSEGASMTEQTGDKYPIASAALRVWIARHRVDVLRMLGATETRATETDWEDVTDG